MKNLKNKKYLILSTITKYSLVLIVAFSFFLPAMIINADNTTIQTQMSIDNPLGKDLTDIPSFIKKAIEIVLTVGIPVLVLAIIYTGFLFIKAQGNKDELKKAKSALTGVLIGGALLLGAFVIAEAIGSTVEEIKSNV
ncbi:MAG: hypothetical protein EOM85_00125 [Candidatus Moranbacteria bacterium]|nr:hypothetical protein [Candidatus Moranbacteria bacterium]